MEEIIKTIKIQNETSFPNGQWVNIAKKNISKIAIEETDEEIYFYVENSLKLENLKVNDVIDLDEKFKIIEII